MNESELLHMHDVGVAEDTSLQEPEGTGTRDSPVFIIGVHRRSGSNYLYDALRLHPAVGVATPLSEDYLLDSAHLLEQYVNTTTNKWWKKRFDEDSEFRSIQQEFHRRLGQAMVSFLLERIPENSRLLTKTPDPLNLRSFFRFFPNAKLILLVRDGRDVTESSYKSWPSEGRAHWMKTWAQGARTILGFASEEGKGFSDQWRIVRYEDVLRDEQSELESLLKFTGLAPEMFPWDRLKDLPVRGSSVHRGGSGELHWQPIEKPKEFKPVGRWSEWNWWTKRQFKRIAGAELKAFGYVGDDSW